MSKEMFVNIWFTFEKRSTKALQFSPRVLPWLKYAIEKISFISAMQRCWLDLRSISDIRPAVSK